MPRSMSAGVALGIAAVVLGAIAVWIVSTRLRAHQRALEQASAQLQDLLRTSPSIVYQLRPHSGVLQPSALTDNLTRLTGYTRDEALAPGWWFDHVHPDDREAAGRVLASMQRQDALTHEYRFLLKDGRVVWIRDELHVIRRENGVPAAVTGAWIDVTREHDAAVALQDSERKLRAALDDATTALGERTAAEAVAQHRARLYAALSATGHAITRSASEDELFERVCEAAVRAGAVTMAWIGLTDSDSGLVRRVASAGQGQDYLTELRVNARASDPMGRGPTGTAARDGVAVWVDDFLSDPLTAPWREAGVRFGWQSSAALPLRCQGRVVGAITLYSRDLTGFTPLDRELLTQMAEDIGFALDGFDRERARRVAAASRDESENRYHTLFSASGVATLLIDPADGRIVDANDAAVTFYGWPIDALRQKRIFDINTLDPDALRGEMARARTGERQRFEFTHRIASGETRDVEVFAAPLIHEGRPLLVSTVVDVTERRRTLRLEAQLLQAQKMEVLGRLAGGIAHDFNNLLTVINGTCDLALTDLAEDDPHTGDFRDIRAAGERAARITQRLLAFSRKHPAQRTIASLGALITGAGAMLRRLMGEDITLEIAPSAGGDTAFVDPSQFEQILLNLTINARDATPAGGVIRVSTTPVFVDATRAASHPGLPPGPYVELRVKDTGAGMTPEVMAQVFEPFFTTKDPQKGTGLGLATVYSIVTSHQGAIDVDSTPGVGTEFRVLLPFAERPPDDDLETPSGTVMGSGIILLVEDDDGTRGLVSRALHLAGYQIGRAHI